MDRINRCMRCNKKLNISNCEGFCDVCLHECAEEARQDEEREESRYASRDMAIDAGDMDMEGREF